MMDYIKEFGDGQKGKTFIPTRLKTEVQPDHISTSSQLEGPEKITVQEVKDLATDLVLELMNADIRPPTNTELLSEQKTEIEQKIKEYCNRPGILSLTYHDDFNLNETSIGAMIDPTNTKNWALLKEEIFYKLPHSYKNALHTFASEIWNKRDLMEAGVIDAGQEYINQLKQQVVAAHKEADARYNEVAHQSTGYSQGNIFQPTIVNHPDAREGHRIALADGQYRLLKKKAIDLETKLHQLEKRVKKI